MLDFGLPDRPGETSNANTGITCAYKPACLSEDYT